MESNSGDGPGAVLIAHHHRVLGHALRAMLMEHGLSPVLLVPSAEAALSTAAARRPCVTLLDLMFDTGIGELVARLRETTPGMMILGLATGSDSVPRLPAGELSAVLSGDLDERDFVQCVLLATRGEDPAGSLPMVDPRRVPPDGGAMLGHLTQRERDVLALLAEGASSARISRELDISSNTVRTHVQNILLKLNLSSRLEAAAFAATYGIGEHEPRTRRTAMS